MNTSERKILASRRWPFLFRQYTFATTSGTQFKEIPQYVGRVVSVYLTSGTTRRIPKECPSREFWEKLNQSTNYTSDWPEYWYEYDGQLGLYPAPATSALTVTINALRKFKDLSITDYTTGNILTATVDSASITGTGTTFTQSMVGRWLKITESDTANKGDGYWYEIATYSSATAVTLTKAYKGTAIAAGSAAYTIGQTGLLPDGYDMLPVYDALRQYFVSVKPEQVRAQMYDNLFKEHYTMLAKDWGSNSKNPILDGGEAGNMTNPNNMVTL